MDGLNVDVGICPLEPRHKPLVPLAAPSPVPNFAEEIRWKVVVQPVFALS